MFFEKSSLTCLPVPITIQVIRSQNVLTSDSHSVPSDIYTASDPQILLLLQTTTQQGKRDWTKLQKLESQWSEETWSTLKWLTILILSRVKNETRDLFT